MQKYPSLEPVGAKLESTAELKYSMLAFSPCGQYLIGVGDAPHFTLAVWEWDTGAVLGKMALPEQLSEGCASFLPGMYRAAQLNCQFAPSVSCPLGELCT